MCAKFYRNRTFNFKVMIKKPISDDNPGKKGWDSLSDFSLPPFPQCNVDPCHVARGRARSPNID